jgi:high-affinity iron transporter
MRMPIAPFFAVTSVLLGLLGVVLAGKGVAALQEAGYVPADLVDFPQITWLGVYPTAQSLSLQAILLVMVIGGFSWSYLTALKRA